MLHSFWNHFTFRTCAVIARKICLVDNTTMSMLVFQCYLLLANMLTAGVYVNPLINCQAG